jgi:ATP-dependent DNA ligase
MTLPIPRSYKPMEARLVDELPTGKMWQYEPKWDGFRCLAFRDGDKVDLMSKAGKPLARYFPDVVAMLKTLKPKRFVLDGEIVVTVDGAIDFDQLLQRIHPAKSRVEMLSSTYPATFVAFDLLVDGRGKPLAGDTLGDRRGALESFMKTAAPKGARIKLSPATTAMGTVKKWFRAGGGGLDGVVA